MNIITYYCCYYLFIFICKCYLLFSSPLMSLISLDFLVYFGQIRKQISFFVADLITFLLKLGKVLNSPPLFRNKIWQTSLIRRINC
jgi:uncharacterized protein with ParB-like and HNH nuclease domain